MAHAHDLAPDDTPLVSTAWLARHLDDPRIRVLDTRGRVVLPGDATSATKQADYDEAHIPGAAFVRWNHDFVDTADPVANQLAAPEAFARRAGELGIGDDHLVVAYDDYSSIFAARLWWAFRAMGHGAVRVLDGGWTSWLAEGRPTTAALPAHPAATFTASPQPALRLTLEQLLDERGQGVPLVDARSRERFAGAGSDAVGGHIPGAGNAPYGELVDHATQRFAGESQLRALLGRAGIDLEDPPQRVVSYCGSGISAAVPLIALELLGIGGGAVYDGSWGEWSSHPELPRQTGLQ